MAVFTILGAGMMGSALALPLVDRGHVVRLVGTFLDDGIIDRLKVDRFHLTLNAELPDAIVPFHFHELAAAARGAEYFTVGVSSAGVEWAGRELGRYASRERPLLMISKGLAWRDTPAHDGLGLAILPDVLRDALGASGAPEPVAVAGPCIAGELVRRVDTCVVFTGRDQNHVARFRELLGGGYYRVFTDSDVVGVEICAALKNAYAMAMAFAAGVHEARGGAPGSVALHNYEAAVFAQSVHEMQLIAGACGGSASTAVGLPGVGDLHVTCNGGRTGRFGRFLGLGLGREAAIARMQGATLECLEILEVMRQALPALRAELGATSLPLLEHMIDVALDDRPIAPPFDRFFAAS